MSPRGESLGRLRTQESKDKRDRVHRIIDRMIRNNEPITYDRVARHAGVSLYFVYKPGITERIRKHRTDKPPPLRLTELETECVTPLQAFLIRKVRAGMERRHLNIKDVAAQVGISGVHLGRLLNGTSPGTITMWDNLLAVLEEDL